jgi:hypothetical protein
MYTSAASRGVVFGSTTPVSGKKRHGNSAPRRLTPAMEAKVADHVWELSELLDA